MYIYIYNNTMYVYIHTILDVYNIVLTCYINTTSIYVHMNIATCIYIYVHGSI